jgi:hypothetical protein
MKYKKVLLITAAVVVGFYLAILAAQLVTRPLHSGGGGGQSGQYTSSCRVFPSGYRETITNAGPSLLTVSGYTVVFDNVADTETGSDNEPGNGVIDGVDAINMNEAIAPGQSWTDTVTGTTPTGSASCSVAQVQSPS